MAEDNSGIAAEMRRVTRAVVSVSLGRMSEAPGRSRTSSKVRPSGPNRTGRPLSLLNGTPWVRRKPILRSLRGRQPDPTKVALGRIDESWPEAVLSLYRGAVTFDDGPLDPFLDDPADPTAVLDEVDPVEPLSEEGRADVLADLEARRIPRRSRAARHPRNIRRVRRLRRAALLRLGPHGGQPAGVDRSRTHQRPRAGIRATPDAYVSWDYARGFTDATDGAARPR